MAEVQHMRELPCLEVDVFEVATLPVEHQAFVDQFRQRQPQLGHLPSSQRGHMPDHDAIFRRVHGGEEVRIALFVPGGIVHLPVMAQQVVRVLVKCGKRARGVSATTVGSERERIALQGRQRHPAEVAQGKRATKVPRAPKGDDSRRWRGQLLLAEKLYEGESEARQPVGERAGVFF